MTVIGSSCEHDVLVLSGRTKLRAPAYTNLFDFEDLIVDLEVKGKRAGQSWDPALKPGGYEPEELPTTEDPFADVEGSTLVKLEGRKYEATLQLVDPDPAVRTLVKRMARLGQPLSVKAEIITGKRRIIMMLFRKH